MACYRLKVFLLAVRNNLGIFVRNFEQLSEFDFQILVVFRFDYAERVVGHGELVYNPWVLTPKVERR